MIRYVIFLIGILLVDLPVRAESAQTIDDTLHHLRQGGAREWSEFPVEPDANAMALSFASETNEEPWTLALRQQDVKERWEVLLNGLKLGTLAADENDMVQYFEVPRAALHDGENRLEIRHVPNKRSKPDDIRVGDIVLHPRPRSALLAESTLEVGVSDVDTGQHVPCRITIVRRDGALQPFGTTSGGDLAVRPGVVYTSTGFASVRLPAGEYVVYAGRGFEYSLDRLEERVGVGSVATLALAIRREVPTEGYVACDTHIHTVTHSGHGDCSTEERMITLAGEGIEFPIATDHNKHIDYDGPARAAGVRRYFTPVIGNEVTTQLGHFNIFPVEAGADVPDFRAESWDEIFGSIKETPHVQAIILNHARDIHRTRPFGPKMHNTASGANADGWKLQANAMETLNSGATQTDLLQLTRDWMTQLNHGNFMTPVGSSDSHTVNTYIVGQGRTYIRCEDKDPGNINVDEATENFVAGRVSVSYGLLTELTVNDSYRSGDLVLSPEGASTVKVDIRVLGPHWADATRVQLYANGELIRDEEIAGDDFNPTGVIWRGQWPYKLPGHDVHLVAVATGPGIEAPYWKMAKPYQPTAPEFETTSLGCSGAVWVDGDGDGKRSSARDYAERVVAEGGGDAKGILAALEGFDVAVAIQAAQLWEEAGGLVDESALSQVAPSVQAGFRRFRAAAEATEAARKLNELAQ
jgi:hypothetical protein